MRNEGKTKKKRNIQVFEQNPINKNIFVYIVLFLINSLFFNLNNKSCNKIKLKSNENERNVNTDMQ